MARTFIDDIIVAGAIVYVYVSKYLPARGTKVQNFATV